MLQLGKGGSDTVSAQRFPPKKFLDLFIYLLKTIAAVQAFFSAMAMHPDIQRKAQAEIDAVVGQDRLPDFSDRAKLPYVNAIVKETLRWHSISPMGEYLCFQSLKTHPGGNIPNFT